MRFSGRRLAIFLSILGTITALLHGYAWLRLVHDPAWPSLPTLIGSIALALLAVALPGSIIAARTMRSTIAIPVGRIAYVWLGTIFYLDVSLAVLDVGRAIFESVAYASVDPPWGEGAGAARTFAGAALAIAAGLVTSGLVRGLGSPSIVRVRVPIADLPAAFDGFRIVQLTDVHIGPLLRRAFAQRITDAVRALSPDLVAVTGDLVDGSVAELTAEVAPLAKLSAPHGVFFVTGNHEYFSGADAWSAHVERALGWTTLRNRHVVIEKDGARLTLAGIDDAHAPRFGGVTDLDAALRDRDPSLPVILLAHQPRSVEHAERAGVALQISGHTHGGQMQPFGALVRIEQPVLRGLSRFGSTALWVSQGTGTWGPPLRVGTRSEISVIELTRA
jgi:predicted MPP superfamily phosphohydrolase